MSSSHYFNLYKEEKEKAEKYTKWIKQLEPIRKNAAGGLDDEIKAVNREIAQLYEDLEDAVKHDRVFSSAAYEIGSSQEAGSGSDGNLRRTQSSLDDEISRLGRKKDEAQRKSDEYYKKYKEEKQREEEEARRQREEALNKLKSLFS